MSSIHKRNKARYEASIRGDTTAKELTLTEKAFTPGLEWEKDDLAKVVHWARQIVGIVCGIIWGLIPLTGFLGNILFFLANAVSVFVYYSKYLGVDDDDFGRWDLLTEGFAPSYAFFLVSWTTAYSMRFFSGQ